MAAPPGASQTPLKTSGCSEHVPRSEPKFSGFFPQSPAHDVAPFTLRMRFSTESSFSLSTQTHLRRQELSQPFFTRNTTRIRSRMPLARGCLTIPKSADIRKSPDSHNQDLVHTTVQTPVSLVRPRLDLQTIAHAPITLESWTLPEDLATAGPRTVNQALPSCTSPTTKTPILTRTTWSAADRSRMKATHILRQ